MTAAAIGSGAAGGTLTPSVALGATLGAILGVGRGGGDGKVMFSLRKHRFQNLRMMKVKQFGTLVFVKEFGYNDEAPSDKM